MLFSSIPFLYYFLPIFFILYFLLPKKWKNGVILFGSLFFYGCSGAKYVILILLSILVGYIGGVLIATKKKKKLYLFISILLLLGLLVYFKYANFLVENINYLINHKIEIGNILLPIGISFYTFQIVSYLIDVYRKDVSYEKRFIDFAGYVVLFPQLIAGPIVRYKDIAREMKKRVHTLEQTYQGITRFMVGLGKKVLIANAMAQFCDIFRGADEKSILFYWMYACSFTLFIYFDFSGYSDMAIGLGKIMGFHFPENFNYPYLSVSITEFWRRWHMTLGSWFRDYVYIPLGGNRVGFLRWMFNIFVVWMLTGLWHGAAWNFVIWGLLFAVLLIIEKITGFTKKLPKVMLHVYVLFVLVLSFVIFNAENLGQATEDISGMFGQLSIPFTTAETMYYLKSYSLILFIAIIGCTPLPKKIYLSFKEKYPGILHMLQTISFILLLLIVTAYLVDGSFNPFLYFRF